MEQTKYCVEVSVITCNAIHICQPRGILFLLRDLRIKLLVLQPVPFSAAGAYAPALCNARKEKIRTENYLVIFLQQEGKKGKGQETSDKNSEWRKKVLNDPQKRAGVVEKRTCTPGIKLTDGGRMEEE